MISLARKTLIHDWRRFAGVSFSVGFAGLLIIIQLALVLGIFGSAAVYVNQSSADIWVGYPGTQSVNYGRTISPEVGIKLRMQSGISHVESYIWVDGDWYTPASVNGNVSVYLSGISTNTNAMMFSHLLTSTQRERLREPGAIIVDPADLSVLGTQEDGYGWINKKKVHIVGLLKGLRGLGGVNIISSIDTAYEINGRTEDEGSTYFVARVANKDNLKSVISQLSNKDKSIGPYQVWSSEDFAFISQKYWVLDTGAGLAVIFMAFIVSLVGAVITSQSLKAVIQSYSREFATLNALGASRIALSLVVLELSMITGLIGVVISVLISGVFVLAAKSFQIPIALNITGLVGCVVVILVMVLVSSISAIRSQFKIDPSLLLR